MKAVKLCFGWLLVAFVINTSHAAEIFFSGTVDQDAINIDLFGNDVEVGDSFELVATLNLSDLSAGDVLDLSQLPGFSGTATIYDVMNTVTAFVHLGSLTPECTLSHITVYDDLVNPNSNSQDAWDLWISYYDCDFENGGQLSVGFRTGDTSFLNDTSLFFPQSLDDFEVAAFAVNTLDQATLEPLNGVRGTISIIGEATTTELLSDLADLVVNVNLEAGIPNAFDRKLKAVMMVLDDANANNDGAGLNSLYAFCNSVEAQRGKKLSEDQVDQLIDGANGVIGSLDSFATLCM